MSDYTPLSPAWEAVLDILAENVPPTEEDDEEIEIAEEIDKIIEILRQIDGGE